MSSVFYKMAKAYYPNRWNLDMVKNLTRLGRLTPEEFKEITGEDYTEDER